MRRRSHAYQGSPRAHGPHRAGVTLFHVWFFKGLPSRIGHLLDISLRDLESVLYFENYVVVDPGDAPVKEREMITDERQVSRTGSGIPPSGKFNAIMGAEAIKELLKRVQIDELGVELRERH